MEILYFLLSFIQPILLFTPEMATIAGGSVALGPFKGFIIGYAGIISGIVVMYFIGNIGREKIVKKLIKEEQIAKFSNIARRNKTTTIAALFLFPVLPDNIICAGAGLTRISFRPFIIIAGITKLATTFIYAYSVEVFSLIPFSRSQIIIVIIIILALIELVKRRRNKKKSENKLERLELLESE